jgi:hypothetical protein
LHLAIEEIRAFRRRGWGEGFRIAPGSAIRVPRNMPVLPLQVPAMRYAVVAGVAAVSPNASGGDWCHPSSVRPQPAVIACPVPSSRVFGVPQATSIAFDAAVSNFETSVRWVGWRPGVGRGRVSLRTARICLSLALPHTARPEGAFNQKAGKSPSPFTEHRARTMSRA